MTSVPPPTAPASDLAAALRFTADELATNRRGHLTAGQRAGLMAQHQANVKTSGAAFWIIIPSMALLYLLVALLSDSGRACLGELKKDHVLAAKSVVATVALIALVFGSQRFSKRQAQRRSEPVLAVATGRARVHDDGEAASVTIDGRKFPVSSDVAAAFRAGGSYRVYYAPSWPVPTILSAEALEDGSR